MEIAFSIFIFIWLLIQDSRISKITKLLEKTNEILMKKKNSDLGL